MGNDGGSIAKRRDLTKQKKVKSRISCESIQKAKAKLCALTQEPLKSPILCCKLGFLYNKAPLLSSLLSHKLPPDFSHIKAQQDVIEAKFHSDTSGLACPVSGIEYNGLNKFFVMWDCGCVLSEKALKEIPSQECIMCSQPIKLKVKLGQTREEQKESKKRLGIKTHKKTGEGEPVKRIKLFENKEVEETHKASMESEIYQSLFSKDAEEETFCCRNLRAGLR